MLKPDYWGWRARFGMYIVSCEAVPEAEWWAMMPPGISVHAARIDAPAPWAHCSHDGVSLSDDLARATHHFASMRLNAVVIGHSSSSLLGGAGWDDAVVDTLKSQLPDSTRVTTNGIDCRAACASLSMRRPFVVFPPWFNDKLVSAGEHYLQSFHLPPAGTLLTDPGRGWRELPPAQLYPEGMGFEQDVEFLYRQIRSAVTSDADGILIAGTGFRCIAIIDALETDLGLPVVTANQASLWHCLRLSGVKDGIDGYGQLFQQEL